MTAITVRRPRFDLSELPRWWVGGSRLGTWFGDAGHVFIPLGEQFFIDAVKEFRDRIDDPDLRREVASFIGQEAVHARAHRAVWGRLRAHGVPVDSYAVLIERSRELLEPVVPVKLRLATTAALEHYTAAYGRAFLAEDLTAVVSPEMAGLLAWHGAEELEHRCVAFDVLAEIDDDWRLRMAGLVLGTALLTVVPVAGVVRFAVADARRGRIVAPHLPKPALLGMTARFLGGVGREVARYVRPGFHPGHDPEPDAYHDWVAAYPA